MTDENMKTAFDDMKVPEPGRIELTFGEDQAPQIKTPEQGQADGAFAQAAAVAEAAVQTAAAVQQAQAPAQAAAAAQQAQASAPAEPAAATAEQIMDGAFKAASQAPAGAAMAEHAAEAVKDTVVVLSPEEQKIVDAFAEKIDLTNSGAIMQYGAGTQKKMSEFADSALANVRNKDMGEVGKEISGLVAELKSFDVSEEDNGFLRFFKKSANKATALQAKYDKTEDSVKAIAESLEKHQIQLLKDVATLDRMYALNLSYFKELTMYIAAGKKKLEEVRRGQLKELEEKAAKTQNQQDAQAAKDLASYCNRFEKKLYDLELTRQIALQTGPQIRLVQDSDTVMAEKIQSTIVNTIPLWKNQMVIALGIEHSNQAAKAEKEVTDMTNTLLQKNAQQLHTAAVETAKASERGVIDMETLRATNAQLIQTLDDVVKIQEEGPTRRVAAEVEMQQMEQELRGRLMDITKTQITR